MLLFYEFDGIFAIVDQNLARYIFFYKESESEVNKMPNFRARRGKIRKPNVKQFFLFFLFLLFEPRVNCFTPLLEFSAALVHAASA